MENRKQIDQIFDKILTTDWVNGDTDSVDELVHNYEQLNEKCDKVISKIKERKERKKKHKK